MRQKKFSVGETVVLKIDDHCWEPCTVVDVGRTGHQTAALYKVSRAGSIVWAWEDELIGTAPGPSLGGRR